MSNMRDQMRNIVKYQDENGDRYWVNDMGPTLNGSLSYRDGHQEAVANMVGLVDEQAGGMIAYGDADEMRSIADKLNEWEMLKEIMS